MPIHMHIDVDKTNVMVTKIYYATNEWVHYWWLNLYIGKEW